jgi:perosamine synthetase
MDEHYPVAEKLSRRGFYIPSGLALTLSRMDRVIDAICAIIDKG